MNTNVPAKIYYRVGVGFVFCLIIVWYFAYRLLFPTLQKFLSAEICGYTTFVLSLIICLSLIKLSIKKELEKEGDLFSLVARNPDIEIPKEEVTIKSLSINFCIGILFCFIISLPVTIIGLIQLVSKDGTVERNLRAFVNDYWVFYLFCCLLTLFAVFCVFPSLKRWHWTKHQF